MKAAATLALAIMHGSMALAYQPSFDPRLHRVFAGEPTRVVVLGTPHLGELPKTFDPATLGPLLDRLAAWRPDIVTIESVSGPECEMFRRYKAIYQDTADSYCPETAPAEKATGLSVAAATAEAERLLAAWPASPTPGERRHLAAVFLAGGERTSALVQWLRLPVSERHAGDGLDAELVATLERVRERRNEDYLVAAPLAARLGLERVVSADDHSADATIVALGAPYDAVMKKVWEGATDRLAAINAEEAKLGTSGATLALYRYFNQPEQARIAFDADFGAALKDASPEHYGRRYVGWWETRNLRMVANIRAAATARPGARVLSIVGASHKGYFESYLHMMHDMVLEDAEALLQ